MLNFSCPSAIDSSRSAKADTQTRRRLTASLWKLLLLSVLAAAAPALPATTTPVELYNSHIVGGWTSEGYYYVGGRWMPKMALTVDTGAHAEGYLLTDVEFLMVWTSNLPNNAFDVSLYRGSPYQQQRVAVLTKIPGTDHRYSAPAGTTLDPNTKYSFVIETIGTTTGIITILIKELPRERNRRFGEWTIKGSFTTGMWANNYNGNWNPKYGHRNRGLTSGMIVNGLRGPFDNFPPTSTDLALDVAQGATHTFSSSDFTFSDGNTDDVLNGIEITALPAAGGGTLALSGTAIADSTLPLAVTNTQLSAGALVYTPPAVVPTTNLGTMRFRVNDGELNSALDYAAVFSLVRPQGVAPFEADFINVPATHDGTIDFTVQLRFSASPTGLSPADDAARVVEIEGGTISSAQLASGGTAPVWELTITPSQGTDTTLRVPERRCDETNAICAASRPLDVTDEVTIAYSAMHATFSDVPESHGGTESFTMNLSFSSAPVSYSYVSARDALFDVTGGTILNARRTPRGQNQHWELTVAPDGIDAVTLTARPTQQCTDRHAVCDSEGGRFSSPLTVTIPGPPQPVVLSVTSQTSEIGEGAPAVFTLTRTGNVEDALTVSIDVTAADGVLDASPPEEATFAADASETTVSLATIDDEVDLAQDPVVSLALRAHDDYELDTSNTSATVTVIDDDATPVIVTETTPIVVAENTTAIVTLEATDADHDAADLTWSISDTADAGADHSAFEITTSGVLTFASEKNFESPDDANGDGDYAVTVVVSDGTNTAQIDLVVRLMDVDDVTPALVSGEVYDATLSITFDEALDPASVPAATAFSVEVEGVARGVDTVIIDGALVVLTLSTEVTASDAVTVAYTAPSADPLRDAAGNGVASFTSFAVENTMPPPPEVVSIVASSASVFEGEPAVFLVSRTGLASRSLEVELVVSEVGTVIAGTPVSMVTLASGVSEMSLSVPTVNDATSEIDAHISVELSASSGYLLDETHSNAHVAVLDDEPAPVIGNVDTVWSSTLQWTDIGHGWYGGYADAFSPPDWTEDGSTFRIMYIAYLESTRTLYFAHDVSGGAIAHPETLVLEVGSATITSRLHLGAFASGQIGVVSDVDLSISEGAPVTVRLLRRESQISPPTLTATDATVVEGDGAVLRFQVNLSRALSNAVSVRYRTAEGTARAGEDYVATQGVLRIAPGATSAIIEVAVLPDSHDEGSEQLSLELSRAYGAMLERATAIGTITNQGPIPKAWTARFARAFAEQSVDAIQWRFSSQRPDGLSGSIAGHAINADGPSADTAPVWSRDAALFSDDHWPGTGPEPRSQGIADLVSGTSLSLSANGSQHGDVSIWAQGSVAGFDVAQTPVSVDGYMTTGFLGIDVAHGPLLSGVMLSHTRADGGYDASSDSGDVRSTLTGVFPYARFEFSERTSLWAMVGHGEGDMKMTPTGGTTLHPGLDLTLGAFGMRNLLTPVVEEGFALAVASNLLAVRVRTDAVRTSFGALEASEAHVVRGRMSLEGSRAIRTGTTGWLVPTGEIGLQGDRGDIEDGLGLHMGAGVSFSDSALGIEASLGVRGLVHHQSEKLAEHSVSASVAFDPRPGSDRGLAMRVGHMPDASDEFSVGNVFNESLSASDAAASRGVEPVELEIGYGVGLADSRFTIVPTFGIRSDESSDTIRIGSRLIGHRASGSQLSFSIDSVRDGPDGASWRGPSFAGQLRFDSPGFTRSDVRIEAMPSGDGSSDYAVAAQVHLSW